MCTDLELGPLAGQNVANGGADFEVKAVVSVLGLRNEPVDGDLLLAVVLDADSLGH